jgi:hypothetical protein
LEKPSNADATTGTAEDAVVRPHPYFSHNHRTGEDGMAEFLNRLCGKNVWSRWSCGKGDVSGFFQLFFDNVATTLTLVFLLGK